MRYPLQAGARELTFDFELGGSAGLVCRGVVLAFFEEIGHFEAQVSGVGGIAQTGVKLDDAGADELLDFAIEMLHAFGRAVAHGIEQRLAFALAFFDVFASAHGGLQDFNRCNAPLSVCFGKQALRNNKRNAFESRVRIACWSAKGKTPTMRSTVFEASMVCSVDMTR